MTPKLSPAILSGMSAASFGQINLFGLTCTTGAPEAFVKSLIDDLCSKSRAKSKTTGQQLILPVSMNDVVGWLQKPWLQAAVSTFDVRLTDGMPLVWLARLKGCRLAGRLYGPTIMKQTVGYGRRYGLRHFFYGGTTEVITKLSQKLSESYPGFKMAGSYCPPFRDLTSRELLSVVKIINKSQADVLWIGIGSWRQVILATQLRGQVKMPLIMTVGAAFDFISGTKSQAPAWMQALGLEWLYRLASEPRRLWRRYLLQIPSIIVFSVLDLSNYFKPIKTSTK